MSSIILPQRLKTQPQYSLQPAPEYADAVILAPFQTDGRNIANSNHLNSFVGVTTPVIRDHGRAMRFTGSSSYRSDQQIVHAGKKITLFAWVRPGIVHNSYFRFLATDYGTGLYLGSDSFGKYAFTVSGVAIDGNGAGQQVIGKRDFVLGVYDGNSAILYVNGREVSRIAVSAPTSLQYLGVGAAPNGTSPWTGDVDTIGLFYRAFSAGEVQEIYGNPARLFKAPARKLWAASSGGTTHDLTISSAIQPNVASAAVISQTHVLAGANGAQANTSATGAITQTHVIAVQTSAQQNTAGAGAITQSHLLAGASSSQANTGTAGAVSQTHALSATGSTQANAASVGAVSVGVVHNLAASPSTQANAGASGAISQAHVLICPASVQDNVAAASAIVQAHILSGASGLQTNLASSGSLGPSGLLPTPSWRTKIVDGENRTLSA